jgi:5-methylcytosine-specific restriction enzyme A
MGVLKLCSGVCGQLVPSNQRRCKECQRLQDARRGTTSQRGYGSKHQRRARQAIGAHPWCEECGATTNLTTDHLTPLAQGGDPLGPLRVLCRRCNSRRGDGGLFEGWAMSADPPTGRRAKKGAPPPR